MTLLIIYVSIALGFSFLCSILEAVLLSVTTAHIELLQREGKRAGELLRELKQDIDQPLAAILTLNTAAHTVGAAGAGAQAAVVFGDLYLGVASGVLTLLILIFSEIIPKTLGAQYWRALAPMTAHLCRGLLVILYPFVVMARLITRLIASEERIDGFSRKEFHAMAELGGKEGQLEQHETKILRNLFTMHEIEVEDVMTPRSVVFSVPQGMTVAEYIAMHDKEERFSRIPVYVGDPDYMSGFVLRSDLLLANARGNTNSRMETYLRPLEVVDKSTSVAHAFELFLHKRCQIMLVGDGYGGTSGIVTLEDLLETLLGLEIVDEMDRTVDMRKLARQQWRRRAKAMGIKVESSVDGGDIPEP